ncbi:Silicon efflux transporter LSI2 [Seminavis robusta]|uniref:Silicon efflux transporter LSI2 n=1 Tax=Seminavis robusta TaxID=568900 RepID=A0A9N8HND8_9STRA|nr:Silicon efflux transporter LSI2 [Seminavis robusta]|eukprot:Sro979_g227220.1 Silicon efflux transporter LSI2 (643) ;mRNA; r:9788-11799
MTSTLYDEEKVAAPALVEEAQRAPKKVSSLRRWAPAMIAMAVVVAFNAVMLGPTGERMPELSDKAQRKLHLAKARTAAVMEMDAPRNERRLSRGNGFGNRNLAEEEGGVMEYTRRRHRYLGEYVHIDVSGEFSAFGKWSVSLIYFAFWVFLMFPNWFLPIGRPGIALGGGLSMVVWRFGLQLIGHGPYFDAERVIIMEPLFLLFGLMLTTIYLEKMERGGLFDKLRDSLDDPVNWKRSAKIMAMSTIGSAAVMNDSIVLIFSGVVVDLCVRHKVANSLPYLLSLATTANIGSALTMTGNPQNILIVSLAYDDIKWLEFASNMVLPVIAATIINVLMMFTYYGSELFPGSSGFIENFGIMAMGNRTPEMLAQEHAYYARQVQGKEEEEESHSWSLWSRLQIIVVTLFLICFACGLDVCVVSICAGAILMVMASYKRQHYDPRPTTIQYDAEGNPLPPKKTYDMDGNEIEPEEEELVTESETTLTEVDYGLLMLFIGQFILIGSFDDTGVPQAFFNFTMGSCADQMTSGACVYWFVIIITILSNIASNVPVCQMLAATFPYASPYDWLQVSYSATIAGNLTMLGSAANMIVAFQAAKVGDRTFTSERHAPFGIPSTIACLYAGTFLLSMVHFSPECSVRLGECD